MAMHREGPGRAAWAIGLMASVLLAAPAVEAKPQQAQRTYRVQAGDSLSAIAQRKLQRASRWPGLYALNRQVVGDNPHLIFPGQRLRLGDQGGALAGRHRSAAPRLARVLGPSAGAKRLAVNAGPKRPAVAPRKPRLTVPLSEEIAFGPRSTAPVPSASAPEPVASSQGASAPASALASGEVVKMPALPGAPNPWVAAGASLALPGAGQAYVGDWGRGAVFAGAAAVMYGMAFYGMQTQNEALARTGGYALLGLSVAAPIDAYLGAKRKEAHLAAEASKVQANHDEAHLAAEAMKVGANQDEAHRAAEASKVGANQDEAHRAAEAMKVGGK